MIEYIHDKIGAKTLFSTHYHELTSLAEDLSKLKNIHVSVVEQNGKVVFLHKMKDGPADKSYGIHVAELADLPEELIKRAQVILHNLENDAQESPTPVPSTIKEKDDDALTQLSFFETTDKKSGSEKRSSSESLVLEKLKSMELLETTPLEAMNVLYELQKKLKTKK